MGSGGGGKDHPCVMAVGFLAALKKSHAIGRAASERGRKDGKERNDKCPS